MIITEEAETRHDRDGGKGWQRIRGWRCRAIETAAAEMYQRGETMGTKKEMRDDEGDGG